MKKMMIITVFTMTSLLIASPAINFSHSIHVQDMEMECTTCHSAVTESTSGQDDLFNFDHETCAECHADAIDENCEMCHTNVDENPTFDRITDKMPDFNHALHLSKGAECASCHAGIESNASPETKTVDAIPNSCIDCHSTMEAKPRDHQLHWVSLHGKMATGPDDASCEVCHTEDRCISCHEGDNTDFTIHPANYELNHGMDFKTDRKDCSVCHTDSYFCVECHTINAAKPMNHNSSMWIKVPDGGSHAAMAVSRIEYCQVCHENPDSSPECLICHQ